MINIEQYYFKKIKYSVEYADQAKTVCITSNCLSDDCLPYRESEYCLLWLSPDRELWGIECIFPTRKESILDYSSYKIPSVNSSNFIVRPIHEKNRISSLYFDSKDQKHFFLIFYEAREPDRKFCFENVIFYIFNQEIIAIECRDAEILP